MIGKFMTYLRSCSLSWTTASSLVMKFDFCLHVISQILLIIVHCSRSFISNLSACFDTVHMLLYLHGHITFKVEETNFKGTVQDFCKKRKYQVTNIIKINEKYLTNWHMTYKFFRLLGAFHVFRLNTSIVTIDCIKNLIALAKSKAFKT